MRIQRRQIAFVLFAILIVAMLSLAIAQSTHLHAAVAMPALAIVAWMPLLALQVAPLTTGEAPLPRGTNVPRPILFQLPPPADLQ